MTRPPLRVVPTLPTRSGRRPWGEWCVLDEGGSFKVERLEIAPGQRLPAQVHASRSEHWVVVLGAAACTIDGEVVRLRAGDHVEVPAGVAHRIANDGDVPLVVVEVQRGDHLVGEDDVRRWEDDDRTGPEPGAGS